jgi:hypothetical protein
LGLGTREELLKEIRFEADMPRVQRILKEIGYEDDRIKEAVVIPGENESGEKYLCAYYVSSQEIDTAALKEYLSCHLPDYMIPTFFVRLEKIPLTESGKLNRNALPLPGTNTGGSYKPPRDEIEKKLVEIWSRVLGRSDSQGNVQSIGIDDNFFDIGGNSLAIIEVNSRLNEIFKKSLPVMTMFRYSTIRSLSKILGQEGITGDIDRNKRMPALVRGKSDKIQQQQRRKKRTIVTIEGRK